MPSNSRNKQATENKKPNTENKINHSSGIKKTRLQTRQAKQAETLNTTGLITINMASENPAIAIETLKVALVELLKMQQTVGLIAVNAMKQNIHLLQAIESCQQLEDQLALSKTQTATENSHGLLCQMDPPIIEPLSEFEAILLEEDNSFRFKPF